MVGAALEVLLQRFYPPHDPSFKQTFCNTIESISPAVCGVYDNSNYDYHFYKGALLGLRSLNDPHLEGEGFVLCRLKPTESCWYSLLFSINNWTRIRTDSHRLAPAFIRANPCPVFSSSYLLWACRHAEFQAVDTKKSECLPFQKLAMKKPVLLGSLPGVRTSVCS